MSGIIEHNGAKVLVSQTYSGYGIDKFSIELVFGKWPSDLDLIMLCGGCAEYGGHVAKAKNVAGVFIYKEG